MIIEYVNGRLRGVLGYKEGIDESPEEEQDDLSENSDEEVPFEESDMELDIQE